MEISSSLTLLIAIGTQLFTAIGLFWSITNSVNNRINDVEYKLNLRINSVDNRVTGIENRVTGIEKDIDYIKKDLDRILDYFPKPKISINQAEV